MELKFHTRLLPELLAGSAAALVSTVPSGSVIRVRFVTYANPLCGKRWVIINPSSVEPVLIKTFVMAIRSQDDTWAGP